MFIIMISNIFNKCNNINKFHFFVRLKYVNREVKFIFIFKHMVSSIK